MQLVLLHQAAGSAPLPAGVPLWRTCVRDVAFLTEEAAAETGSTVVAGADAYALLVEIVSGLRSPLVGETEVQAQFKAFLASLDDEAAGLKRIGQRVLGDAKQIRQRHLQGFGAHSYGRLVASRVPEDANVVLVGTGALAFSILEHLDHAAVVHQWGRRPPQTPVTFRDVPNFQFDGSLRPASPLGNVVLVVAAPASAADLDRVMAGYGAIGHTIDLRPSHERAGSQHETPTTTLDDLFAEARTDEASSAARVAAARGDALRCATNYAQREEFRPFGWDDLCA